MTAVSGFEHLSRAAQMTHHDIAERQSVCTANLETGASTVDVNALRTCTMAVTVVAVGVTGVFESMLQTAFGWGDAYVELDKELRSKGFDALADRFSDYRLAINVLKHGEGRSYEKLLARRASLPFRIKGKGEHYFEEGDVSEVGGLIDGRSGFLEGCVDTINEIRQALNI